MSGPEDATFEFSKHARQCLNVPQLSRIFQAVLSDFGVTASSAFAMIGADSKVTRGFGEWPADWARYYAKQDYFHEDPVMKAILSGNGPGFWDELSASVGVNPNENKVMQEAALHGYTDGYSLLVATPNGAIYLVSLYAEKLDRQASIREMFELTSYRFVQEGSKLLNRHIGMKPGVAELTSRQLEVLQLKAFGLTNVKAAEEIGVSVKAIEDHLDKARKSLGVRRTIDAVEFAKESGMIRRPPIAVANKLAI